ncbi:hypothetical protein [Staphylococcus aureus]
MPTTFGGEPKKPSAESCTWFIMIK